MDLHWKYSGAKNLRIILDVLLILLAFFVTTCIFAVEDYTLAVCIPPLVYTLLVSLFLLGFEVYLVIPLRFAEIVLSLCLTSLYAFIIMLIASFLPVYSGADMPMPMMLLGSGLSLLLLLAAHLSYKYFLEHRRNRPRLLILDKTGGDFSRLKRLRYANTKAYKSWYEQIDTDDPQALRKSIEELLPRFDSICLLEGIGHEAQKEYIQAARNMNIGFVIVPALENMMYSNISLVHFDDVLGFHMHPYRITHSQAFIKRATDLLLATVLIALAAVPMLLISLIVYITSPGPVIYSQERVTAGKKHYKIYKFRTMVADAEKLTGPTFATKNDPRITPVGRFLRKCRMDELPQLFNILMGHMSLVGPRPERPFFVEQFGEQIDDYEHRFVVKAGLTSLSHVYGRYSTDIRDRTRYDLLYVSKYSWLIDIKILLQTSRIIFLPSVSDGLDVQLLSDRDNNTVSVDKRLAFASVPVGVTGLYDPENG